MCSLKGKEHLPDKFNTYVPTQMLALVSTSSRHRHRDYISSKNKTDPVGQTVTETSEYSN